MSDVTRWRLSVSAQRRAIVVDDIVAGSAPRPQYYAMMGLSVLLSGFGLLVNSPAVVIGAMLVSPLMTPIFGVSLALSRGDLRLLADALLAEFGGVLLAIALAYVLGLAPLSLSPTTEMLARTSPTLMDLMVAALAGVAGCIAMIDERIGPALPGVAIATALTPPLATCGLSLAFGSYEGASGAFLLFFANFLAILAVSTLMFILAGFVTREEFGGAATFARRFGAALVGLAVVTVLLTQQLFSVIQDRWISQTISHVVHRELRDEPNISVLEARHDRNKGRLQVMAVLRTPRVISPARVTRIQDALASRLDEPVDLYFRCALTKDVAASGAVSLLGEQTLDGNFDREDLSPTARIIQIGEQSVRDLLTNRPDIILRDVSLAEMPVGPVLIVSIQTSREPVPQNLESVQELIRQRTQNPDIVLVVRTVETTDLTPAGRVLYGSAHFADLSEEERAEAANVKSLVKKSLEESGQYFAPAIDVVRHGEGWAARANVVGPTVVTPEAIEKVEKAVGGEVGAPVVLHALASTNIIVSKDGYESVQHRTLEEYERRATDR